MPITRTWWVRSKASVPIWVIGWGMLGYVLTAPALADPTTPTKDQIEGAYLLNFAQLVTWPPEAYGSPDAPTVIGIPAGDTLLKVLGSALDGRRLSGRRIELVSFNSLEQVRLCHILFVRKAGNLSLPRVLAASRNLPVLTVGDIKDFTLQGGTIWLFENNGRIGFDVNRRGERSSQLRIDSRLLRLARNVLE